MENVALFFDLLGAFSLVSGAIVAGVALESLVTASARRDRPVARAKPDRRPSPPTTGPTLGTTDVRSRLRRAGDSRNLGSAT